MNLTNYITTTELRTKSAELVKMLKQGVGLSLIHRSKIIGKISPQLPEAPPIKDIRVLEKLLKDILPGKIINRGERKKRYRQYLKERYGKSIS
ncbi:hypothetical protein HYW55_00980 [Candidatus Gottesmanbacteria bacterium]|nr:hypothetical protein [Candidatus Gottesmanbacteria bacterium]